MLFQVSHNLKRVGAQRHVSKKKRTGIRKDEKKGQFAGGGRKIGFPIGRLVKREKGEQFPSLYTIHIPEWGGKARVMAVNRRGLPMVKRT